MESEIFRTILLVFSIPFAAYKLFRFYKKLYKFSPQTFKDKLENFFKF